MDSRILETHVEHHSGYVVLNVAIKAAEGFYRVHYDRQPYLSEYAIKRVVEDGRLLSKDSATAMFAALASELKYDSTPGPGDYLAEKQVSILDAIYLEAEQCLNCITITDPQEQPLLLRIHDLIQQMRDERIAVIAG